MNSVFEIRQRDRGISKSRFKQSIVRFDNPISLTETERLSYSLFDSIEAENPSLCLNNIGSFVSQIPQRLGTNTALDDATTCLLSSYSALFKSPVAHRKIDPKLYGRALRSLQKALEDPEQCRSTTTLCATILLHRLEVSSIRLTIRVLQNRYNSRH